MKPNPPIAVVGPTASGKSELALDLAERFDGEIVGCDSVQVYRGFDIGSAKTPPDERRGVPHHLIDVVDPAEVFSAGDYARLARQAIEAIRERGRTPVVAGGTGFYLRALFEGLFAGPGRDAALRARLERREDAGPPGRLHRLLRRLDPASAARIHPRDRPKLVRALEVRLLAGRPVAEAWRAGQPSPPRVRPLALFLDPPREALKARIERRARAMFEAGLVDEVRGLLAAGVPRHAWAFGALGYREALAVAEGRMREDEAIAATALGTRRYAKRQSTWFRNQHPEAVRLAGFGDDERIRAEAERLAAGFLRGVLK